MYIGLTLTHKGPERNEYLVKASGAWLTRVTCVVYCLRVRQC